MGCRLARRYQASLFNSSKRVWTMSLRDALKARLEKYAISDLKVDKDHVVHGVPSIHISFNTREGTTKYVHDMTFARDLGIDSDHIAEVVSSYLKRAGREEA